MPSLGPDPDEQLARHLAAVRPFKAAQLLLNFRPGLFTLGIGQLGYTLPNIFVLQTSDDFHAGRKTTLRTDRMHGNIRKATVSESFLKHTGLAEREYGYHCASPAVCDHVGNALVRVLFRR